MPMRRLVIMFASGMLVLTTSAVTLAQRASVEAQPGVRARVSAAPVSAAPATRDPSSRRGELEEAIVVLNELIRAPVPPGLTRAELSAWNEQTEWLTSVRDRYRALSADYAAPAIPGGAVVSAAVSGAGRAANSGDGAGRSPASDPASAPMTVNQLNDRFTALQQAIQNESRKFQTLSNALKARHDVAMNSIRNMKA